MRYLQDYTSRIAQVEPLKRKEAIEEILNELQIEYKEINVNGYHNIHIYIGPRNAKRIVLNAHYDNVWQNKTPGANDNAAACAIILNVLKELKDNIRKPIEVIFFDGEELGGKGSKLYLESVNLDSIDFAICMDMCGQGPNILYTTYNKERDNQNNDVFNRIVSDFRLRYIYDFLGGDAYSFKNFGIPTIYIVSSTNRDIPWYEDQNLNKIFSMEQTDFGKTMHTVYDTPEKLDYANMETIKELLLEAFR